MIELCAEHLAIIKEILYRLIPECEVRVFGSRYQHTARQYSDLDLAVVGQQRLDWRIIANIKEEFQESDLPFRVDVLDWYAASPEFRQVIAAGYDVIQKGSS
jgi:predicted nucleotidyltransferase